MLEDRIEDHEDGPCETQSEAISEAIAAAHRAGTDDATSTQVLVQRLDPTCRILRREP